MARPSVDLWLEEETAVGQGFGCIVGIDEAGRGPLAGPVVAACVHLPFRIELPGITDSKKLTPPQREDAYARIMENASAVGVGECTSQEIDSCNILRATHLAMVRALQTCRAAADLALIDGLPVPRFPIPQRALVKGDARSKSIAAASIIAKVTRDRMMRSFDQQYPGYRFAENMGYPTPDHLTLLRELGPCPIHRRSFAPVAQAYRLHNPTAEPLQPSLTLDPREDGRIGETVAAAHLRRTGWQILSSNFRVTEGEIDIVASKAGTTAFCEVKTHRHTRGYRPAARVDADKQRRIILAAEQWLAQNPVGGASVRFDVLEVVWGRDGLATVQHIEDAFGA
jgi:ribonuclease HII